MKNTKIPKRYTKALFDLSMERASREAVAADLQSLGVLITSSKELESFLKNPLIPATKQTDVLMALFQSKVDSLTLVFLKFLAERKKLKFLLQICEEMERLYAERQGILRVRLTSTVTMRQDQVFAICEKLRAQFGKSIEPETRVDQDLLGGFKVSVGDLIYDLSVSTHLNKFRQKVLTA